jgi:tRNA-dihydrouridine synthase
MPLFKETFSLLNISLFLLSPDDRKTVELCRQAEHAGASWISIHARTVKQRNEPPTWDVVKLVSIMYST